MISAWLSGAVAYARRVAGEMERVKWATKDEVISSSLIVVILTVFVAVFVMCVDMAFVHVVESLLGVA